MSIATKTGDDGTTAILFGHRVPKTHPRIAANGACDELNAALGLVRAFVGDAAITAPVFLIQKELVTLMGELAVLDEDRTRYIEKGFQLITTEMVSALDAQVDYLEKNERISYKHWATPGATPGSAYLDLARTACRRAERAVAELSETGVTVNPEIIRYLNRLSDLIWLWARWVETKGMTDDE